MNMKVLYDSIRINKKDIGKSTFLVVMSFDELCSLTVEEVNGIKNQRLMVDLINATTAVEQKEYNLR